MASGDQTETPDDGGGVGNITEFTVSELSFALKRTVEDAYGHVRVRGELGRISRPGSGHIYLDLKDDKSVIAGIVWRGVASKLKIQPQQGLEVIVTGKLTTYPGQSKYQIVIEAMEPAGLGALMALLEERRKKLAAEGLFDEAKKQALPYLPRVIGVVTSPSGAVIRDILHRLADRFPVHVIVWPVRVQGETSGAEVAAGIHGFNALESGGQIPRPDLIIVARGGGSVEDLWGFNEEIVVRAASESQIPLVSAVGHETDWTLLDHAADLRAPTPTGAAEMAVPVRAELLAMVSDFSGRLKRAMRRVFDDKTSMLLTASRGLPRLDDILGLPRQRIDAVCQRMAQALALNTQRHHAGYERHAQRLSHALILNLRSHEAKYKLWSVRLGADGLKRRMAECSADLAGLHERLHKRIRAGTNEHQARLAGLSKLLASLGYQNVLERGFVLVRSLEGKTIARAKGLDEGTKLALEFHDGQTMAQILTASSDKARSSMGTPGPKRAKPKRAKKEQSGQSKLDKDNQGRLF